MKFNVQSLMSRPFVVQPLGCRAGFDRLKPALQDRLKPALQTTSGAFTLIEMIVVITIIGLLAALLIGVYPYAHEKKIRGRVHVELKAIETIIESYKEKKGFFPPDNVVRSDRPALYYELTASDLPAVPSLRAQAQTLGITNIVNLGSEDSQNFYKNVRQSQIAQIDSNGQILSPDAPQASGLQFLAVRTRAADDGIFAFWNYDAHTDNRHNHESFDLWVDVKIGGKTVRIGNWND
jgi:prepilin-type N-terminal cleavage/methylation domain-containing protein